MHEIDRFIRYAKIDTQADASSGTTPSTEKQKNLAKLLVEELKELGLTDAYIDEYGIVYAHLDGDGEPIGLNAHMDTALEVSDANCQPRLIKNYNGKDIKLNDFYTLSSEQFPNLKKQFGNDLIVTDGNTLLGADDKAGIAIIMSALEYFKNNPKIKHHPISVAFTVDEEIGEGPLHFSLEKMNASYAYTIDGSYINDIEGENFNAKAASLKVEGVAVHPGEGKNALLNAIILLDEWRHYLPMDDTPFEAGIDDGFYHLTDISGTSEKAELNMILRDFDKSKLNNRVFLLEKGQNELSKKYPKAKFILNIVDQYENMKEYVIKKPEVMERAKNAIIKNGLIPTFSKIRGGTDGATFSKMGLITPNLGTGSYNHHGRFEYLVVQEYLKMINIVIDILKVDL